MDGLGLDRRYGAYLDHIPGVTLATVNLMSLFGLHRRLRGAIVGHLALFEMTSSIPNARYARGLRRLGFDDPTVDFFDEHVEADAVHENIAAVDLAGGLVRQEPEPGPMVLWGARALSLLDVRWAEYVLERWEAGESSLLVPGQPADGGRRALTAAAPGSCLSAPSAPTARGSARACGCRRRTGGCASARSGTGRPISRPTGISRPSWSRSTKGPRTSSGPSR